MKPAEHILVLCSLITIGNFLLILTASVNIEFDPQVLIFISEASALPRLGIFLILQLSLAYTFGYLLKESTQPSRVNIQYAFFFIIGISAAWITGFNIQKILFTTSIQGTMAWIKLLLAAGGSLTLTSYATFTLVRHMDDKREEAFTILIILFLAHAVILSALVT
ncbi:hypothetical protein N9933_03085 [bacterium]|nr:hypothetical protein [bacterium]